MEPLPDRDLGGKRAIVTGASSGLGRHFAGLLAAAGADVTLAARRPAALPDVQAEIEAAGGRATVVELDVTDAHQVETAFGGAPFDIVVNNAGITETRALLDTTDEGWNRILDTNLVGSVRVARAAARRMIDGGVGGSIVNVASILGHRVAGKVGAYATSKAGLVQFTRAAALEWARYGIRVNALCPGYVETPLNSDFFRSAAGAELVRRIPMRKLCQMSDLDAPLMLVVSDGGRMMTGTEICVDGGHLVSSL